MGGRGFWDGWVESDGTIGGLTRHGSVKMVTWAAVVGDVASGGGGRSGGNVLSELLHNLIAASIDLFRYP